MFLVLKDLLFIRCMIWLCFLFGWFICLLLISGAARVFVVRGARYATLQRVDVSGEERAVFEWLVHWWHQVAVVRVLLLIVKATVEVTLLLFMRIIHGCRAVQFVLVAEVERVLQRTLVMDQLRVAIFDRRRNHRSILLICGCLWVDGESEAQILIRLLLRHETLLDLPQYWCFLQVLRVVKIVRLVLFAKPILLMHSGGLVFYSNAELVHCCEQLLILGRHRKYRLVRTLAWAKIATVNDVEVRREGFPRVRIKWISSCLQVQIIRRIDEILVLLLLPFFNAEDDMPWNDLVASNLVLFGLICWGSQVHYMILIFLGCWVPFVWPLCFSDNLALGLTIPFVESSAYCSIGISWDILLSDHDWRSCCRVISASYLSTLGYLRCTHLPRSFRVCLPTFAWRSYTIRICSVEFDNSIRLLCLLPEYFDVQFLAISGSVRQLSKLFRRGLRSLHGYLLSWLLLVQRGFCWPCSFATLGLFVLL